MGGVNTNRSYASTMGFGYFDESRGQVEVTHPLLQGGIVSRPVTKTKIASEAFIPGCGLLSSGCPHRCLYRRLARRQVWKSQDHRHRICMDHLWRRDANRSAKLRLDVLCSSLKWNRDWYPVRHHTGLGD